MYLNSHGNKPAVRALYNQLGAQGLLINFQPGVVVKVTSFYGDGTAQIAGDRLIGYIATDDVSEYLGPQRSNWEKVNDNPAARVITNRFIFLTPTTVYRKAMHQVV